MRLKTHLYRRTIGWSAIVIASLTLLSACDKSSKTRTNAADMAMGDTDSPTNDRGPSRTDAGLDDASPPGMGSGATARKRDALLRWFSVLPNRDGARVIAGQFVGHGEAAAMTYSPLIEMFGQETGKNIAMAGADYGPYKCSNAALDLTTTNQPLVAHWRKGGLVTVSWHAVPPFTNARGEKCDPWACPAIDECPSSSCWSSRNSQIIEIACKMPEGLPVAEVVSSTPTDDETLAQIRTTWLASLDRVAAALMELRDAGVVVLWRPFHEMNGGWFWWSEPESHQALWRHMHGYFASKGLDNLIWVWAASGEQNLWNDAVTPPAHYPGDDYVDIVGFDYYLHCEIEGDRRACEMGPKQSEVGTSFTAVYQALERLNKPIALAEFGPNYKHDCPLGDTCSFERIATCPGYYDYVDLLDAIQTHYPKIIFFQAWHQCWSLGFNGYADGGFSKARALMNHPLLMDLDELDFVLGPAR